MLERVGLLALLCVTARVIIADGESTPYQPALAMYCGKATQHRDVNTGEWISGDVNCISDEDEMLSYCKKAYPTLTITNVLEAGESVHVPAWCNFGSRPPCKGHGHNVRPVKCVVGQYVPKALDVMEGCTFEHKVNYSTCYTPKYWESEAAKHCRTLRKTLSTHQMLTSCQGVVDQWKGVQFLCCKPPIVAKPKPNKGKKVPISPAQPGNVNSICLQPKRIGLCRALLPAWHYNADSGECEFFHYGGCGGNDNNFQSKEECMSTCIPLTETVGNPKEDLSFCSLAPVQGPCMAYFTRFYYDPVDAACKSFVFGGCMGNKNNFIMKDDCEAKCKSYKKPQSDPVRVQLPISLPVMSLGPVMLDGNMKPVQDDESTTSTTTVEASTTTTATSVSSTPFYTDETTIDNEHEVFTNKMDDIKSEHRAKVNAILAKWDEDNARMSTQDRQDVDQLEQDLQTTITALEDEYDGKMSALKEFHMDRMDRIVDEQRSEALQNFLDQLNADKPKLRHILNALEKYIAVERQDKTHIMEHYAMALRDDFDKESVPDFRSRIENIETRVNKTRTVLMSYPDILRHIQDEVEEILATIPDSPDFDYDGVIVDDGVNYLPEEEIVEIPDMDEDPTEIDDGGIPDPDICKLPPVIGDCKASLPTYYFNTETGECTIFFYGGCGGNENNFVTLEECQAACPGKPKTEDACSQPRAVGFCRAALSRFYFNADAGTCQDFTYGGCGGNKNNFETLEECNSACPGGTIVDLDDIDELPIGDVFDIPKNELEISDDNSIQSSLDDEEEETEDEAQLDKEIDKQYDYYGNPIFDVNDDPQALVSDMKTGSVGSNWAVWISLGAGFLFILAVVAFIVIRRNQSHRPPMKISVDKPPEESEKELSAEEKQLLALQQNGYENPTFKFFEKRQMA